MIRTARHAHIERLLRHEGALGTRELSAVLGVSAATVRRDLEELRTLGRIERVFGGARLASARDGSPADADEPFDAVAARNAEAKTRMGRAAAQLIDDGECIYIDVGTSALAAATHVRERHLTIVTGSLAVIEQLGPCEGIELIVLGGEFHRSYRCTQGRAVERALARLQVDTAILGCSGITERGVVRDTDPRQALVKRAALETGARTVLLADATKLPGTGAHQVVELSRIACLVTDGALPEGFEHLARDSGPRVIAA